MLPGRGSGEALGSPVWACDSDPVTYSAPVRGNRSPVSEASMTYEAPTVIRRLAFRFTSRTARTRSPSTSALSGIVSNSSTSRPEPTAGASISWSTASATLGSWHRRETDPSPGLRFFRARASSVSG